MSAKGFAMLYAAGKLRGDRDSFGDNAGARHIAHRGVYLACHSSAPPAVDEYERWLAGWTAARDPRTLSKIITAGKLRRMVVMRRQGSSFADCGRAVGLGASPAKAWLDRLPEGLAA